MSFTRSEWSVSLLTALGNPNPSQTTLDFVIGWTAAETVPPGASFNLLNTTEPWPDTTDFNSVGVRNYATWQDGIGATVTTLKNGYYPELEEALRINLGVLSPPTPEILANLHTWCGGCGYGKDFVMLGSQHAQDTFDYANAPGGFMPKQPTVTEPSQFQLQAALAEWNSIRTTPTGTGIYEQWLADYINGVFRGPPLDHEYSTIDWNGNPIIKQQFLYCHVEWSNGLLGWYGPGGKQ